MSEAQGLEGRTSTHLVWPSKVVYTQVATGGWNCWVPDGGDWYCRLRRRCHRDGPRLRYFPSVTNRSSRPDGPRGSGTPVRLSPSTHTPTSPSPRPGRPVTDRAGRGGRTLGGRKSEPGDPSGAGVYIGVVSCEEAVVEGSVQAPEEPPSAGEDLRLDWRDRPETSRRGKR